MIEQHAQLRDDRLFIQRIAQLSETRRGATAAVLKILGRDAIALTDERRFAAMGWIGGGIIFVVLGALVLLLAARRTRSSSRA